MSKVHRYQVVTMLSAAGATIGYDPHGPDVVMAADFDRVTAERDAALDELKTQTLRADAAVGDANEAERRLTAADERAAVLERLLRRSQDFVAFVHKCVRRNGEYAPLHRQEMDELNRDLSDYIEPGVPVCEQCRGEGRVGGPAPDEGGGKNCPACDGTGVIEPATDAALKPAEGGGDAVGRGSLSDKALSLIDEEIRSKGLPS